MQKLKIFLTGGSSFIGRNFMEQLGKTFEIVAPAHAELDLTDSAAVFDFLKKNPVDVVVHAANVGGNRKQQVSGSIQTNLKIFFNLVRAKPFFSRMIMLGSGAEYNKQQQLVKVKETDFDKHVPGDEYGFFKYVCSKYAAKVDYITHLRLFAVFGKYEDYETRFISNAICRALLKLPVTIRQNVMFDYLFIDDLINILEKIIIEKPAEIFINVGLGEAVNLKTLAGKVLDKVGYEVPVQVAEDGWAKEYSCDTTRLRQILPAVAYTPVDDAIAGLVAYYKTILPGLNHQALTE